jgi:hypothetical protein
VSEEEREIADHPPKIFVSYRWSSPDHQEWVLRLATSLRASGIDVKLDKWHLKEGQDTLAFMESMVNDETIQKVLLICDVGYVERANSREGGVGTEAQIISAKVYNDTNQDKFAAIVVELDEFGAPILPTYMSTRLYFDMSSADAEAINFERVVRWIFNQPFHALPPIGEKPDFLGKTYATGSPLFRVGQAASSFGARLSSNDDAGNVLSAIAEESQAFHLRLADEPDPAEKVYNCIKETRPVAENAYRAIRQMVSNSSDRTQDTIHAFFESLMKSWDSVPLNTRCTRWDNDVYQYFVHDLFVSFVAISMEQRSFELAAEILSMPFFKPRAHDQTGEAADYTEFRPYAESLDKYGSSRRRISLHADLLNEAHEHSVVSQTAFMEADLTLHLRGLLVPKMSWYPISALYLGSTYGALPTYVRAKSRRFYERLKPLLVNTEAEAIRSHLSDLATKREGLRFDYRTLDVERLIAAPELATSA